MTSSKRVTLRVLFAALVLFAPLSAVRADDAAPAADAGGSDAGGLSVGGLNAGSLGSDTATSINPAVSNGFGSTSNPFGSGGASAPTSPGQGLPVAGWLFYPSLLIGGVFNDNVYLTQTHKTSAWGVEFRPSLVATLNEGIHKTTVYGNLDAQFYNDNSQGNTFNGSLGFVHIYEVQRDLILRVGADVSRFTAINNSGQVYIPGQPLLSTLTNVSPQQYNQYTFTAGISKTFSRFFVDVSASVVGLDYANTTNTLGISTNQNYQNGVTYGLTAKAGYWFSPVFYAYLQPSISSQSYNTSRFDSNGYRVVAGIGSDRISLFKGEIYAGVQGQNYSNSFLGYSFGNVTGGVFGGQISWFPTPAITVGLHVDQTLGASINPSIGSPLGSPTRNTTVSLTGNYALSQLWSASAHIDYAYINYVVGPRRDDLWAVGAALNYKVYENLGVALEYKYTHLNSNVPLGSYSQNVVTIGATYKY